MQVSGYVNSKRELVYSCPSCLRKHTHGWIVGAQIEHRVSHCPIDDQSVSITVENFEEAMDAERATRRERNARSALNYYQKHKSEVQKRKLLKRMALGYSPKPSTLAKYEILQDRVAETNLA